MANPKWVKGRSGNPGGRPKQVLDVIRAAREHTAEAVQTLVTLMRTGESEAARVQAARELLNRGWGLPQQRIELGGRDGGPLEAITRLEIVAVPARPALEARVIDMLPAPTGTDEAA